MGDKGKPVEISGAITFPEHNIDRNVPQPRQPHNLQGLLRFCMEATKSEDAPNESQFGPMDEERRKFLEDALKSMTIDVIEILQKNIKTLQAANTLSVDSDPTEYLNAFESILDHIDHIDTANDFHKIGGFMIFQPCFDSVHGSIRAGACDVLAELCQNNPYCQKVVTANDLLKQLLDIVNKDPDDNARIKAVYAVSCNVRENAEGLQQFMEFGGLQSVLKALQRPSDRLRTKCAFLLSCLAGLNTNVRDALVQNDAIPLLISLIASERQPSHEHLLSLLVALITDFPHAISQCSDPKYNLGDILRNHLQQIKNKDECQEEVQYCQLLLNTIFKEMHTDADR